MGGGPLTRISRHGRVRWIRRVVANARTVAAARRSRPTQIDATAQPGHETSSALSRSSRSADRWVTSHTDESSSDSSSFPRAAGVRGVRAAAGTESRWVRDVAGIG